MSEVEENLNDPAWKPLKSKRQIFEGSETQYQSGSISNLDAKFEIETGIVEQRKSAVIEPKETSIDVSKKAEPNIAAYRASLEAKQLKQLLENNSASSPAVPKKNTSIKKELPPTPKKPVPLTPKNKNLENDLQLSTENLNKLYNDMFQEIESAIESDDNDISIHVKQKPLPKFRPSVPEKPSSGTSSPVPPPKKIAPPATPLKPSTPNSAKSASPLKTVPPPPPAKTPIKKTSPPPLAPESTLQNSTPNGSSSSLAKTLPPPPLPSKSKGNSENSPTSTSSTPIKKTLPPPPLPIENNESSNNSASKSPPTPIKKTSPPPPLPIEADSNQSSENTSPTSANSNSSPSSIIALQKKALMIKNSKKLPPPPPPVENNNNPGDKRESNTQKLASQLSRSLSLNDGSRGKTVSKDVPQTASTLPSTPSANNLPLFPQLPKESSFPKINDNNNIPNLCDVTIHEEQDASAAFNLGSNYQNPIPKRSHSGYGRRNHPISMYGAPTSNPSSHVRARSSSCYHSKGESESEKLPDSLRSFFNDNEINEVSFIEEGNAQDDKKNKENDSISNDKSGNRGFLFNKSIDQETKKQRHQSKLSASEVPDSMKLLFGGFGNVQELDSDSDNDSENDEISIDLPNIVVSHTASTSYSVGSVTIPEDSTEMFPREYGHKIYPSSNKDKNCRNSSIINASIVPEHEPPIPSLDKKPFRGNTLRWVINVNC